MGWIKLCDPAPPGFFSGAVPDPTECMSPEEERALEDANECQYCDHGRVLVYRCKDVCECGYCPDLDDCPNCMGHEPDKAA